jgi:hypothetical protein
MGNHDPAFAARWESKAAAPAERLMTLKAFHAAGIFTWLSIEPTLAVKASLAVIEATHGFVDLYKIGRANYLPMTKTTDWESHTRGQAPQPHWRPALHQARLTAPPAARLYEPAARASASLNRRRKGKGAGAAPFLSG